MNNIVVSCRDLYKSYSQNEETLKVLDGINLNLIRGQSISVIGSSGSGKSTLLHIMAGLCKPTSGSVMIDGCDIIKQKDSKLCQIRNQQIGFVYQFHHLLPEFTAFENVLIPALMGKYISNIHDTDNVVAKKAIDLLSMLDLENKINFFPSQLSGGQRQRVAIARALINQPQVIFADEPSGNLDNATADLVLELFFKMQKQFNTSLIIATHDSKVASRTDLVYSLHNGHLMLQDK